MMRLVYPSYRGGLLGFVAKSLGGYNAVVDQGTQAGNSRIGSPVDLMRRT